MAKPPRSPVLGYNHNVRYHGRVFHVQTEDSGLSHHRLYTHLFHGGTILASKKREYEVEATEDAVRLLMQQLHKAMIKELTHGSHDERIGAFFVSRGEPAMLDGGSADGLAAPVAPAAAPAPVAATPAVTRAADVRQLPVSGSIEIGSPRAAPQVPQPVTGTRPHASGRQVGVVKQGEVKRPPVVLSSSADGVVVQRNVVINVGGGTPPVNGTPSRAGRPRPAVPYVVREGSYPMPTASRASGAAAAPSEPQQQSQPLASGRDIRMPWDTPVGRTVDAAVRTRAPAVPSERTPSERAFAADLVSDKSLDEVILEYLSDDPEPEGR